MAKYNQDNFMNKQKLYFSILFNKNELNFERDVYFFHELSAQINFNYNYLAENAFMKTMMNLTLPTVQNYLLFKISYKEDYINEERFLKMRLNDFAISGDYFPNKIKAHELVFSNGLKNKEKGKFLKIKMINNLKKQPVEFKTVNDIFSVPTDIIIFIVGGGFISDMEKIAQYWLRKQPNQNIHENKPSHLYHQVQNRSSK